MSNDRLERYIWLIDTIRRHGSISRRQLDELWAKSPFSSGGALPRRTFYNYRQAIAEIFNVEILCNPATYEYYLSDDGDAHNELFTNWLLDSMATNNMLATSRHVADKIFLENIPSARNYLSSVVEALSATKPIRFDYHAFGRATASVGVVVEPYFVKLFRQRWYVTGRHTASDKVKTYALDRITNLTVGNECFKPDPTFDAEEYSRYSFGIIVPHGEVKQVVIKTDSRQAQYFRALPLHWSQQENIHDNFSIFHYRLRLSNDLINELLSYGSRIEVLGPPELIQMIRNELQAALTYYS